MYILFYTITYLVNSISYQHRKYHFDTHIFQFASFFAVRYQPGAAGREIRVALVFENLS